MGRVRVGVVEVKMVCVCVWGGEEVKMCVCVGDGDSGSV